MIEGTAECPSSGRQAVESAGRGSGTSDLEMKTEELPRRRQNSGEQMNIPKADQSALDYTLGPLILRVGK